MKIQLAIVVILGALLVAASRKPTTQATSPMQDEGLNPNAVVDGATAEIVQPAQATIPAPALLEPESQSNTNFDQVSTSPVHPAPARPPAFHVPARPVAYYYPPRPQPSRSYSSCGPGGCNSGFRPVRRILGRR
jgi:hypothetical protein